MLKTYEWEQMIRIKQKKVSFHNNKTKAKQIKKLEGKAKTVMKNKTLATMLTLETKMEKRAKGKRKLRRLRQVGG